MGLRIPTCEVGALLQEHLRFFVCFWFHNHGTISVAGFTVMKVCTCSLETDTMPPKQSSLLTKGNRGREPTPVTERNFRVSGSQDTMSSLALGFHMQTPALRAQAVATLPPTWEMWVVP